MSAHDQLERQLRASVAHHADRRLTLRLRPHLWSRGLSAAMIAVSAGVALGVVVFALVALHHRGAPVAAAHRARDDPPSLAVWLTTTRPGTDPSQRG